MLSELNIVAFTHQALDLADVGQLVIPPEELEARLACLKERLGLNEVFYVGTCNRVEVIMISGHACEGEFHSWPSNGANARTIAGVLNPSLCLNSLECGREAGFELVLDRLAGGAIHYQGLRALEHLVRVSCSLESMVVGEKEILAQVRTSYEESRKLGFCGDLMRMVMDCVVKAAKEVYTNTRISEKPISVVSLAYRKLKACKIGLDARILVIGAGKTNTLLSHYLFKHGYRNFKVFSRTIENARILAKALTPAMVLHEAGSADPALCYEGAVEGFPLDVLARYRGGFDVLLICTSSTEPLLNHSLYSALLAGDGSRKVVIDLGLPGDLCPGLVNDFQLTAVDMPYLQGISRKNLEDRYNELSGAEKIIHANIEEFKPLLHQRKVEIAMRGVPKKIREIRARAVDTVFAKDLELLDASSRETLEKVLNYMEKKYISVPMVMAREIMVKNG